MAGKIFINYRRGDDPQAAGRLFDRLENAFGAEQLFMDVDNIEPGLDFVRVLTDQVAQCDVLISVIGQNWLDARDKTGARRLDNPADFVRIEIESALQQDKRVIPVLVGQAQMPSPDELPDAMKPLARRNAVRLTHERFRADTQALITALQRALKNAEDARAAEADAARLAEQAKTQRRDEEARQKAAEAKALERAREEEPHRLGTTEFRLGEIKTRRDVLKTPAKQLSTQVIIGSVVGVAVLGVLGVWLVAPAVAPAPAPSAPTQTTIGPLSPTQERALKPKDTFKECGNCPQMLVVPAGSFMMGSPASEPERGSDEGPQHTVTIGRQFAVDPFALTFDEWDACVADGGCNGYKPSDEGWGRGRQPVINVSWDDAKAYLAWLAGKTGTPYRLLSEAEYEYATRAGTTTAYPWGNVIGKNNAHCNGCGTQWWNGKQAAPVGSLAANGFGLYDMVGNVWEWTGDCYHDSYNGAPADGSAWTSGDCSRRVIRGGSWLNDPQVLRSAYRGRNSTGSRYNFLGFRVGRTLTP